MLSLPIDIPVAVAQTLLSVCVRMALVPLAGRHLPFIIFTAHGSFQLADGTERRDNEN